VSTVGTVSGLGLGPLLADCLAQYAPDPLVLPFLVEIVLLAPAAAVIWTLPPKTSPGRWRPSRPQIPAAMRPIFATSGTTSFLAFTVMGLFFTLIPTYIVTVTGSGTSC
jgi:hypothetical protein